MGYEFLYHFYPKVISVHIRDNQFWEDQHYVVHQNHTQFCNFGYAFAGRGRLVVNGQEHEVRANRLFHFANHQQIHFTVPQEDPLQYITIHYTYKLLSWAGSDLRMIEGPEEGLPFNRIESADEYQVKDRMEELHRLWTSKGADYEAHTSHVFQKMIYELLVTLQERRTSEDPNAKLIHAAMNYIKHHYREPLQRDELARAAAVSPSYFSILFKKYSGFTLTQYIHKLRMDKAKLLLRSTREPIALIAKEVGFDDALYFARIFSRETGRSPSEYRKG